MNELHEIYEMATLHPKEHGIGVDVKLNILQPGDKKLPHEPRVKVIKKGVDTDFSIELNANADKMRSIGDYKDLMTTKEYNLLMTEVKRYREAFLAFWHDPTMSVTELQDLMKKVDAGEPLTE